MMTYHRPVANHIRETRNASQRYCWVLYFLGLGAATHLPKRANVLRTPVVARASNHNATIVDDVMSGLNSSFVIGWCGHHVQQKTQLAKLNIDRVTRSQLMTYLKAAYRRVAVT